jgi:GNAT superfamily N-acetyltransferase
MSTMQLYQVDDLGRLFISPAIQDWSVVERHRIDTVIDLEGGLDAGVPTVPNQFLYIYFPIYDETLPDLQKLQAIARLGASLIRAERRVLSHCRMGFNRSALVAGVILHELGVPGPEVVERLRKARAGALFNEQFASYLAALSPGEKRRATRELGNGVVTRLARADDRDFVLATATRLGEFGAPPWRTAAEIVAGEVRTLLGFFEAPAAGSSLLLAEDTGGRRLGFAYLESPTDYFTGLAHGHIGILAVAQEAEGTRAGGALLKEAEVWSRSRGFARLTLHVFAANRHAREVYEHLGYSPETLRYVKPLD